MPWVKRGVVLTPPTHLGWSASHAAVPTVHVDGDRVRIFFTTRDDEGRSHVAVADFDPDGRSAPAVAPEPVLVPGPPGTFDDSGAMSSCVVAAGGRLYLYYVGWLRAVKVPFYTYSGVAISNDGGATFEKLRSTPILDRSPVDPFMAHTPWVTVEDERWRMWYASCIEWLVDANEARHRYHIKYAESADGIEWRRDGVVAIDFAGPDEYALARPCVLRSGDGYMMWFSHRGQAYRIGFAESDDGITWSRDDARAGIDVSSEGWDSEMIEYPCVFEYRGRRHMLYNGNDYGRSGIGHAVWEDTTP